MIKKMIVILISVLFLSSCSCLCLQEDFVKILDDEGNIYYERILIEDQECVEEQNAIASFIIFMGTAFMMGYYIGENK